MKICFVTENVDKLREVSEMMSFYSDCISISSHKLNLTEIQGDITEVATAKAIEAAKMLKMDVLVDDTALTFESLGNALPGPYIKQFIRHVGQKGTAHLLNGFDSRRATAICTFAVCSWPSLNVSIFQGFCYGKIAIEPRGVSGFGWDSIFIPDEFPEKT